LSISALNAANGLAPDRKASTLMVGLPTAVLPTTNAGVPVMPIAPASAMSLRIVVHRPELALLVGALGRFGGLERIRVNALERQVAVDVLHFARLDVGLLELWDHLPDMTAAERTLVIGKLDNRDRRVDLSLECRAGDDDVGADGGRPGRRGRRRHRRHRALLNEGPELGELLPDRLELLEHGLHVVGRLREPDAPGKDKDEHDSGDGGQPGHAGILST
jgi:hypothetical protein